MDDTLDYRHLIGRTLSVETKSRVVRLRVQTKDMSVEGILEVPTDGYRGRLLDYLNGDADYLALTDALLWNKDSGAPDGPMARDVMLLRRSAIQSVVPLHDRR
jgi:hypothetical protein